MNVPLALAAVALSGAACSGAQLQPDAGQLQVDAAGVDAAIPPGGYIAADVNGVTIRAETMAAAYSWSGLQDGWLDIEARNSDWLWALVVQNVPGPSAGAYAVLYPVATPNMVFTSFANGGACAATVTVAASNAGEFLEGTFTATLDRMGGASMPKMVVNGSFRLPRVNAPPPPL